MTLAQMIARLTRGYIKETGRQPVGLDKLRIKMEAAEKLRQMNKIIQFPQQRSFKKEIEDMIEDGTIKMGGVTKQSDKVRTRNMFKDSNLNKPKAVKTEAELKAEIEAGNKKSIQNLKDKLDNPEDMADGGVAGLLGERTGFRGGGMDASKSDFGKSKSKSTNRERGIMSRGKGRKGTTGNINNTGGGGGGNNNTGGGGGGGPPGTNTGGRTTTTFTNVPLNFREIIRQRQILKSLGLVDEKDLVLPGAGKVGKYILKKAPEYFDDKGMKFIKDFDFLGNKLKLKGAIDYKDMPKLFKGKPKGTLGLEGTTKKGTTYGFDMDKNKNINLGIKIPLGNIPKSKLRNFKDRFAPDISEFNFEDLTGIKPKTTLDNIQLAGLNKPQTNYLDKVGKKIPSALDTTDLFTYDSPADIKKGIESLNTESDSGFFSKEFDPDKITYGDKNTYATDQDVENYMKEKFGLETMGRKIGLADGGPARQNFAMGKRAFLKLMGGVGAGIAGLKSGLIGMGGKKAAVKEVVKQSAGSGTPPPYFFKLAEKIKKLGSDTTPTNDRTVAKSLKSKDGKSDYILEEDVASGDTIIKKVNKEGDEMITDVQIMELRKGEVVKGKDGKARKTPDEYEEVTEANARIEGDVFNDPYYTDGIEIDDILREVDDIPVPKASGGIARMLGE
jgi:hypothetical protein